MARRVFMRMVRVFVVMPSMMVMIVFVGVIVTFISSGRSLFNLHTEIRSEEAIAVNLSASKLVAFQIQFRKLPAQMLHGQAHIDQGSQDHIARDAIESVEVENLSHFENPRLYDSS